MSEKVQVVIFNESNNKMEKFYYCRLTQLEGHFGKTLQVAKKRLTQVMIHAAKREIREEIGVEETVLNRFTTFINLSNITIQIEILNILSTYLRQKSSRKILRFLQNTVITAGLTLT